MLIVSKLDMFSLRKYILPRAVANQYLDQDLSFALGSEKHFRSEKISKLMLNLAKFVKYVRFFTVR